MCVSGVSVLLGEGSAYFFVYKVGVLFCVCERVVLCVKEECRILMGGTLKERDK